ncbi:MAG: hypothetical protein CMI52_04315 [Parcubacteria group bacterium]|nr:hypothetical protein [Parcubacteria group bacterium]
MHIQRSHLKQWVLLIGDAAVMYASLYLALFFRRLSLPDMEVFIAHARPFSFIFFLWIVILFINGMYDLTKTRNSLKFIRTFFEGLIFCLLIAMGFFYFIPFYLIEPRTILILTVVLFGVMFLLWRGLMHSLITSRAMRRRVLFIGARSEAYELVQAISKSPSFGYEVTAILDLDKAPPQVDADGIHWLSSIEELKPYLKRENISTIVVSPKPMYAETVARELFETIFWYVEITDLVSFYESILGRIPVTALNEMWFLENLQESQKKHYDTIKHLIDIVLALILGVLSVVLLPFVALAIYAEDRGPLFYKQKRLGKHGREFTMFKFRTMTIEAEKDGAQFAKHEDPRVTKVGKVLRKTRIDELPQLVNILRGDMTLIGPRPERPEFVEHFSEVIPFYTIRHLVKPGLTGWAQINNPYYATVGENMLKLQYDLFYIKNRSALLDARILLKTINTVLRWMGI